MKMCLEEFKDLDKYDIADKYIEGEPEISSETVNRDEKEILDGMDREDLSETEGLVKYDILFYAYVPSQKGTVKFIETITGKNMTPEKRLNALKNVYGIEITKQIRDEVTTMCNVSYGIEKRGRAEGREITIVATVKNLMKNLGISIDQALKLIEVPESEYQKYRSLIGE